MKKSTLKLLAVSLVCAAVITFLAASGWFFSVEQGLNDLIYQQEQPESGEIVIVGIDAKSSEALGPYSSWDRDIVAMVIDILNFDEETRPAVIGVDVVYSGYTYEDVDDYLVDVCAEYGNVVLAMHGEFGSELWFSEASGRMERQKFRVTSVSEPFSELKAATRQGHINAMYDADGILRHALHHITLPDGSIVSSFNSVVSEMYAEKTGAELFSPALSSNGFYYIQYTSLPDNFFTVSLSDVLYGEVPADWFADKIVLIGPTDPALQDFVTSSIDHAVKMYGIEVQANLIESQLSGNYKVEVAKAPQLIALFVISFAALAFFNDRKILWATIAWLAAAGGYVGVCYIASELGYVLNALMLPAAVTALYIATVAVNYVRAAIARRRVTNTFMRYVAPEVVREILKEGTDALALGGKLTHIAVLFVDIRGFTPMSEVMSPPEVVEILNKYLTLTSTCIMQNSGTLDKFIGDATMAIWNAPLPQDDYVYKAVKTALDMVEMSNALGDELESLYGRRVSFGIGVHCGEAVVGNIGASMRMDYTAIGDTVNTSARLESNAKSGQILVSEDVVNALGGRIRATSLGNSIKLKGKSDSFEIFSVDGLEDA